MAVLYWKEDESLKDNVEIVNSIDRALELLEVLHSEGHEMGISEIAKAMGEYQSTIYRTLATLEQRGFVYQNNENSKYGLGMKLYAIGIGISNSMPLIKTIIPYTKELSKEFNETINVSVLDKDIKNDFLCTLIHQEAVRGRVLGSSQVIGSSSECYCSAVGKALMAFSRESCDDRLKTMKFQKYTENTITDWKELSDTLKQIRVNGYALDDEEQELGSFCVACPILGKDGEAIAAISVSGPRTRMQNIGIEKIIKILKEKTYEISRLLR